MRIVLTELTKRNMKIASGIHILFSFIYFFVFVCDQPLYTEHKLLISVLGIISYIFIGFLMKESSIVQNFISASAISLLGLGYWLLVLMMFNSASMHDQGGSWVGPGIVWIFYIPHIHGLEILPIEGGNYAHLILLVLNFALTPIIFLIIQSKALLKRMVSA